MSPEDPGSKAVQRVDGCAWQLFKHGARAQRKLVRRQPAFGSEHGQRIGSSCGEQPEAAQGVGKLRERSLRL